MSVNLQDLAVDVAVPPNLSAVLLRSRQQWLENDDAFLMLNNWGNPILPVSVGRLNERRTGLFFYNAARFSDNLAWTDVNQIRRKNCISRSLGDNVNYTEASVPVQGGMFYRRTHHGVNLEIQFDAYDVDEDSRALVHYRFVPNQVQVVDVGGGDEGQNNEGEGDQDDVGGDDGEESTETESETESESDGSDDPDYIPSRRTAHLACSHSKCHLVTMAVSARDWKSILTVFACKMALHCDKEGLLPRTEKLLSLTTSALELEYSAIKEEICDSEFTNSMVRSYIYEGDIDFTKYHLVGMVARDFFKMFRDFMVENYLLPGTEKCLSTTSALELEYSETKEEIRQMICDSEGDREFTKYHLVAMVFEVVGQKWVRHLGISDLLTLEPWTEQ